MQLSEVLACVKEEARLAAPCEGGADPVVSGTSVGGSVWLETPSRRGHLSRWGVVLWTTPGEVQPQK